MTGGALAGLKDLVRSKQATDQQAYDMARSGYEDTAAVLRKPRSGYNPALALAAGFLSPTRSGSFGESLGKAVSGYADATKANEDAELDRETKLAAIKQAQARLLSGFGDNRFSTGLKMFELPGMAVKYGESLEDLQDLEDGGSGIPAMPGTGGVPAMPKAPATPPSPAPTSGGPLPAPNANVGSVQDVAAQTQMAAGEAPAPMPGQGQDALAGGAGQDTLAFAGNEPPTPAEAPQAQPPQQAAQAAPAAPQAAPQPQQAAPQAPSQEQQLYNWALQVRQAAAANPSQWSRRPKYKFALEQANKVIDDYRASQNAQATQVFRQQALDARQAALEAKEAAQAAKNPIQVKRQEMELKRMDEVEAGAREAADTRQALAKTRAARENLWLGEDWSTGGIMGHFTNLANNFKDTGKGAVDEATGALRSSIIQAQNSGAISNFEVQMFDAQVPGLKMGKQTADWVMKVGEAIAARQQEMAKFYRRYQAEYGTIQGADERWQEFQQKNPIIDRNPAEGNRPWLYPERVNNWQPFLKPPAYMLERGGKQGAGGVPQIQSADDYNALKPGTQYLDPQGNLRTKK